jgi:L-lactate dehydrogenase complex protein LldG
MNDTRDRILARLHSAGIDEEPEAPVLPEQPVWDREERIRRFTERMQAVRAEVIRVSASEWPARLWQSCNDRGLGSLLYGANGPLAGLLQSQVPPGMSTRLVAYDEPIEHWKERMFFETDAALTSTVGGIAETGTLILWPGPQEPRLMSLVPPVHFAVIEADRLYTTFDEAVRRGGWTDAMPTNALLISGPSKSADIEQTLAYGVHGPRELICLLVD